ncbi:hypothetical protein PQX77_000922 [Marasmius sp. AFHP31]|nr:hypothetical protein PQX77_000922 [Marasmius sp. AFHP31]
MSMHNRVHDHAARRLRARQADGSGDASGGGQTSVAETTSTSPTSTVILNSNPAETSTSTTPPTTTPETTPPTTSSPTPPTTTQPPPTTTPATSTTSTQAPPTTNSTSTNAQTTATERQNTTTSTSSSRSAASSSSSSVSSSSSSSATAPVTQTTPTTPQTLTANQNLGGTFTPATNSGPNNFLPTSVSSPATPNATESSAPATSGGIKTGAVAGGVLGGIVGIAIIAALIAMIIRRKRSRDSADQFDAAQFRRSAMIMEDPPSTAHSPTQLSPPPPRMGVFEGRDQVMSVASTATGPGMAGQGAYAFQAQQANGGGDYNDYNQYMNYLDGPNAAYQDEPTAGKNSAEYYSDSFSQQIHPTTGQLGRQAIQQRQQYTFGETFGNVVSDDGHSDPGDAYGSYGQAQAQQGSYNPEAYSSYYNNAGAVGQAYSPAQDPNVRLRPGAGSGGDKRTPSMMGEDAYGGI